jgi:hypothetical protein
LIRWARQQADWVLGFQDETWWSRLAHPALHTWSAADQPLRLIEPTVAKDDPDRKALACDGLLLRARDQGVAQDALWLRFVAKRPVSAIPLPFLEWCCGKVQTQGKRALLWVWDNASWHVSPRVKTWIRAHHRHVRQSGQGVRLLVGALPTKSPWLNPIEPKWIHGKRRLVEPERLLTAEELRTRAYATFHCAPEPAMSIPDNAPC